MNEKMAHLLTASGQVYKFNKDKILYNIILPIKVAMITISDSHVLLKSFDGEIWGSGKNKHGELGFFTEHYPELQPSKKRFIRLTNHFQPLGNDLNQIVAGYEFTVVTTKSGSVFTRGSNFGRGLGIPHYESRHDSVYPWSRVEIEEVKNVVVNWSTVIALTEKHGVYGWGKNNNGSLKFPFETLRSECRFQSIEAPERLNTHFNIVKVALSNSHSMFLDDHGNVWVTGDPYCCYGISHKGVRKNFSSFEPVRPMNHDYEMDFPAPVVDIFAGPYWMLLLLTNGEYWGCQYNPGNEIMFKISSQEWKIRLRKIESLTGYRMIYTDYLSFVAVKDETGKIAYSSNLDDFIFHSTNLDFSQCINWNMEPDIEVKDDNSNIRIIDECIICMDREITTILIPCCHYQFCGECASHLKSCPICISPIEKASLVYRK